MFVRTRAPAVCVLLLSGAQAGKRFARVGRNFSHFAGVIIWLCVCALHAHIHITSLWSRNGTIVGDGSHGVCARSANKCCRTIRTRDWKRESGYKYTAHGGVHPLKYVDRVTLLKSSQISIIATYVLQSPRVYSMKSLECYSIMQMFK